MLDVAAIRRVLVEAKTVPEGVIGVAKKEVVVTLQNVTIYLEPALKSKAEVHALLRRWPQDVPPISAGMSLATLEHVFGDAQTGREFVAYGLALGFWSRYPRDKPNSPLTIGYHLIIRLF